MQLVGAAALVTGGASGLGRATATALAQAGAAVVIADLAAGPGATVAEQIGARFAVTDVTDEASVQAAVDLAGEAGPLRVAVNCAGIGTPGRVLGKNGPLPLDQFARVVTVNLVGTFNVLRLAAAAMAQTDPVEGERGVVVNTASAAAFDGQIGQVAYSASKGGVVGLTLPAARDLASSLVRVMTIAPGLFDTPMLAGLPEPARQSLGAQVPMPSRLGDPGGVRRPRDAHRRQPDAQRRGHPPGRGHPDGAALIPARGLPTARWCPALAAGTRPGVREAAVKVVWSSSAGRYSDNPRAMYEHLVASGRDLEHLWLSDPQHAAGFPAHVPTVDVPGARRVLEGAGLVLANTHLDLEWDKAPGPCWSRTCAAAATPTTSSGAWRPRSSRTACRCGRSTSPRWAAVEVDLEDDLRRADLIGLDETGSAPQGAASPRSRSCATSASRSARRSRPRSGCAIRWLPRSRSALRSRKAQ